MYYFPFHPQSYYSCTSNKRLILGTALVSLVFAFVLGNTGFEKHALTVLVGLPLLLVFLFNTDIIIIASIVLLFSTLNVWLYKAVVLSSIPITVSYFIMHKAPEAQKIKNPLTLPLLVYCACMLPSFWNIHSLFNGLINLLNFASMIVMFNILGNHIKDSKQIKLYMMAFLIMAMLNGINVIIDGLVSKERAFGFAGVVFVDYVNIAILISAVLAFYFGKNKINLFVFICICIILFISMLFTQTRNALISLSLSFLVFLSYLYINNKAFLINRKKILLLLLFLFAIIFIFVALLSIFVPEIFSRIHDLFSNKQKTTGIDSIVSNSLISRLLIWHTALNAFFHHPIAGIGVYSFRFDSQHYRTIPLFLYKLFVKDLSPHITYLTVLTETGIVGIIGFLFFLLSTLKMGYASVKHAKNVTDKYFSLGVFITQIYVSFSMATSDAWIWGQCGMLWSIILGISVGNYKITMRENTSFGKK